MFILSQGLCSFSGPASKRAGGAWETGRGHMSNSGHKLDRGIFHTIWRHAEYISWGKKKEGRGGTTHLAQWHLSSQVTVTRVRALLPWGWPNTCPPMGSGERFPCFALLACRVFALLIKWFLSQPLSFTFLSDPPPHPSGWGGPGGVWESSCMVLGCQLGLNHSTLFPKSNR